MDKLVSGRIAEPFETLEQDQFALFDKIINLRFIRRNPETSFTVRSDYDIEFDSLGRHYFRKCRMKPDISISYKRKNGDIFIAVNVRVANLHLQSAMETGTRGKEDYFGANDNPIDFIKVQLGYFSQFPDFTNEGLKLTPDDYYNLYSPFANDVYQEINLQVLAIFPIKMPPDGVTEFMCVIGNNVDVFNSKHVVDDRSTKFGRGTKLQDYLFENVTRVFSKDVEYNKGKLKIDSSGRQDLQIRSMAGTTIIGYYGKMSPESAAVYGVKCYVSEMINKVAFVDNYDGTPWEVVPVPPQSNSIERTLRFVKMLIPDMVFMQMFSGDFLIYHKDETAYQVSKAIRSQIGNLPSRTLPAITSVTYSGLRSITCPFTSMLEPFMEIAFNTRYNLASLVGYFYRPKEGEQKFYVISIDVNFDTVGDNNEMRLITTDSEGSEGTGESK